MDREEIIEVIQMFQTQQAQMIDILMMILKHSDPYQKDVDLVDHVHNVRHQFLSELTPEELDEVAERLKDE